MAAVVHGNVGRRATAVDRKVTFKSVLENPLKIPWPHVPLNIQNAALAALVTILTGVAEYHVARQAASRKRRLARHDKARKEKARKKRKLDDGNNENTGDNSPDTRGKRTENAADVAAAAPVSDVDPAEIESEDPLPPPPPVFSHLTFGINEVTRRLEAQSHALRPHTSIRTSSSTTSATVSNTLPPLTYIFVCRADMDPPLLVAHLPELVAACNVPSPATPPAPVYLIPLPSHAEHTIAAAAGLRRASVLALDSTTPSLDTLAPFLSSVQPPSAPWLTTSTTAHVPTHIKQLRTTAPRDMRAAKRARTEGRHAAKEKKKEKVNTKNTQGKVKPRKEKKKIKITVSTLEQSTDHRAT